MECRFIFGRAGSGKTYYCLSRLAQRQKENDFKREAILIVPEQATFVHELRLLKEFSLPGLSHVQVTSFERLIFGAEKYLPKAPLPSLSESGKLMAMVRILSAHRGNLQIFDSQAAKSGFIQRLMAMVNEFKSYNIEPGHLALAIEKQENARGGGALKEKLADLALLYQDFNDFCKGKYTDPIEGLNYLAEAIESRGFLAGREIYIDGFSGFTPQEEGVIAALFKKAAKVEIALALDPALIKEEITEGNYFYPLWRTYRRLYNLAGGICRVKEPLCFFGEPGRFNKGGELDFLEKNLYPLNKEALWGKKPEYIKIRAASNPEEEIKGIAREILRLVREKGYRFKDISLIARSTIPYEDELQRIFEEFKIPYFIDSKKPLIYHPLAQLIFSIWDIAALGWHYQPLFSYFKNSLSPLEADECDELENYCLAAGIRHYHWESPKPWNFWPRPLGESSSKENKEGVLGKEALNEEALNKINILRQKAGRGLGEFYNKTRAEATVNELCIALRELLAELEIENKLGEWANEDILEGKSQEAAIHRQAWGELNRLLDEAQSFMGELILTPEDFGNILKAGLQGLDLAIIPPGLDQVFIASIDRSRNPEIKAAFVLGVNAGEMPQKIGGEGLLTQGEREVLKEAGFDLAPDNNFRQLAEDFLIYIAFTRASKELYLSYSISDSGGKSRLPSPVISRIHELFPSLEEELPAKKLEPALLGGKTETLGQLALGLQEAKKGLPLADFWNDVYNWYLKEPEFSSILSQIIRGLFFNPISAPLNKESLKRLYQGGIRSSVSRLEKYRACPFAYFATYGLRLKNREIYQLSPMDRGQLFHEVLADIGRTLKGDAEAWANLDENRAEVLVNKSLAKFLPNLLENILASSPRYEYLAQRLKNTLINTLLLWAEHMQKGEFIPIGWELTFGRNGQIPALKIPLDEDNYLEISGIIDRIDAAVDADTSWVRIVDYKTGKIKLKMEDVLKGLQLQLLVYLQVVMNNSQKLGLNNPAPAGVYYSWVRDDLTPIDMPPPGKEEGAKIGLRLEGLTVKDAAAVKLADKALNSGYSKLIPVALKTDGDFYANSPGLEPEELESLQEYLYDLLKKTAAQIMEGFINASPRQSGNNDICKYCDYQSVCGFSGEAGRNENGRENGESREEDANES